jgi:xanthine dehydrogenase molybdopterin-binding subunit B
MKIKQKTSPDIIKQGVIIMFDIITSLPEDVREDMRDYIVAQKSLTPEQNQIVHNFVHELIEKQDIKTDEIFRQRREMVMKFARQNKN